MTKVISSLYDNTLQAPLQQTEGASNSYSSTVISNVARKCINNAAKEATASHNLTSCSNSEVLSNRSKAAKDRWKNPKYREKMSEKRSKTMRLLWENPEYREKVSEKRSKAVKLLWEDPEYREKMSEKISKTMRLLWEDPEYREKVSEKMSKSAKGRWKDPEYREKVSEKMSKAAKLLWEDPKHREKVLDGKKSRFKNPELIELSRQRAEEAIASILAQTQQQKIKVDSQEDVLPIGDSELQMTDYSRVIHEINNFLPFLPILPDLNDPIYNLSYELEGSID